MRGTNCMRRGNAAGASGIAGGTKTATAGIPIAIGMTTITIATNSGMCFPGRGENSSRPFSFGRGLFAGIIEKQKEAGRHD
jgi:hypothetical protein